MCYFTAQTNRFSNELLRFALHATYIHTYRIYAMCITCFAAGSFAHTYTYSENRQSTSNHPLGEQKHPKREAIEFRPRRIRIHLLNRHYPLKY